jgi:hypothetical protein
MCQIIEYNERKKRFDPKEVKSNFSLCVSHNLPLKYFCETCQVAICSDCGMGKHKNHGTIDIEEYFTKMEKTIRQYVDQLNRKSTNLKECLKKTENCLQMVDKATDEIKHQIEARAEELFAQVLARKEELLEAVDTSVLATKKNLDITKSDLEFQLGNTESLSVWANAIVSGGPSCGAEISKDLLNQLKKCSEAKYTSPTVTAPVFTPSKYQLPKANPIGELNSADIR